MLSVPTYPVKPRELNARGVLRARTEVGISGYVGTDKSMKVLEIMAICCLERLG